MEQATRAASGGAAAQAIAALVYRIHIEEATYEADADYRVDRKGRMRIDVYAHGKRVYTECYDGHAAWEMDGSGTVKPSVASGAAALWHGTQFPGQILALAELPAHGYALHYLGRETIDGTAYDVLKLTMRDGFETYRYLDTDTHQIVRGRDVRALHPALDPKKTMLETAWSDYRAVNGVMRPFLSTQSDVRDGRWLQTARVESIRKLEALPDAMFVSGSAPPVL